MVDRYDRVRQQVYREKAICLETFIEEIAAIDPGNLM